MPMLSVFVTDEDSKRLLIISEETGRKIDDLIDAAVSNEISAYFKHKLNKHKLK